MTAADASTRYGHVASVLRDQILQGRYPVGDELPAIAQLADAFQVSHMTAKQALRVLKDQGVVATGRGVRARVVSLPAESTASMATQLQAIHDRLDSLENRTHALEHHESQPTRSEQA